MARPQYSRLYFTLVGLATSAAAVGIFMWVSLSAGRGWQTVNEPLAIAIGVITFTVFYRFRLLLSARSTRYMLWRGLGYWLLVVLVTALAYILLPEVHLEVSPRMVQKWALWCIIPVILLLAFMRWSALRVYASDVEPRIAAMIRPGPEALELARRLNRSPILGIRLAGYFDTTRFDSSELNDPQPVKLPHLGGLAEAEARLRANEFDVVIVGMGLLRTPESGAVINALNDSTASIYMVPEASVLGGFKAQTADIAGIPLLALHENQILGLARLAKRTFDMAVAGTLLLLLAPVMGTIALLIKLDSPGPILFRQKRYGHSGDPIWVNKFRSMRTTPIPEHEVRQATADDPRVTRVGRILRRTSLDELPQLWNVLNGTMSLVGPRPHAAEHNEFYRRQIPGYMLRHTILPGITGWAQVNGLRGETETLDKMARRVAYDLHYIRHWSLWLDIKILLLTAWSLVHNRNVY